MCNSTLAGIFSKSLSSEECYYIYIYIYIYSHTRIYIYMYIYIYVVVVYGYYLVTWCVNSGQNFELLLNSIQYQ